jgi:pimeloyl-ACP methyl ester carboxylesterase
MLNWAPPAGELRDVGLHVRVLGSGSPTILLLHGIAASHRYFGAAFDVLADHGRLVVPDLLGFGGSPRPEGSLYGPREHAEAVIEALERLGAEPPFFIGAHSAGTLVATEMARTLARDTRGVVAFAPPFYRSPTEARAHIAGLGLLAHYLALDTAIARWTCLWMCRQPRFAAKLARWLRPELPPEIAEDGLKHTWTSYSRTLRNLILGSQPPRDLGRILAPTRWIVGREDPVVDHAYLAELVRQHEIHLERWPGHHELPLSAPGRCVDALTSALKNPTPVRARS